MKEQPVEEKEQPVEEEEKLEVEKDVINPTEIPEIEKETKPEIKINLESWTPKTSLGRKVKAGEITNIDNILDSGLPILEEQIVDILMPNLQSELLMIGQSKGKFGGGSRRIFKQTQKKTPEGNKPSFACMAVVGNSDGYVGVGYGKSKDTVPAREKAVRNAKLAVFKIRRGAGSWEDTSPEPHSIPFAVQGKCGSIRMHLLPAPKGKGLIVEQECAKILRLAGIESVYSKTSGQTRSKVNVITACIDALKRLNEFKPRPEGIKAVAMIEGRKHK